MVTGAATAIEAIAAGRKAAHAIDAYVRTGKPQPEPAAFNSRKDAFRTVTAEDLREGPRHPRRPMPVLPAAERVKTFAEVEQGYSLGDLRLETARCLECGCQALFVCDLRRYATEYGAEINSFLGEAQQYNVDRRHPLIELDPNKCILCGRCVRICSDVVGVAAFGFVNRGFQTVVRPALGGSLLDTDCVSCGMCIGTCPTGAISEKVPLAKPGPWPTTTTPTICHYCGVGCRLSYESYGDSLINVSRREDDHPLSGDHCKKGRFGYNYIQAQRSPDRRTPARGTGAAGCLAGRDHRVHRDSPQGAEAQVRPRRDRGLRIPAADQRRDLPGPEVRADRPGHAPDHFLFPALQPPVGSP